MTRAFPIIYERDRAEKAFEIILRNRHNELKQIAQDIGYPTSGEHWQEKILLFCLDIDKCFLDLSEIKLEDADVHKCITLMQIMSKNKNLNEVQKTQLLAYNVAEEFKKLYEEQE
ncbi:MAG: hypothetical protein DA328_05195 [Nitrososphaeraceae archaeon]|nr:hypothetical protein [Nitrososphaeraceae archaeon]